MRTGTTAAATVAAALVLVVVGCGNGSTMRRGTGFVVRTGDTVHVMGNMTKAQAYSALKGTRDGWDVRGSKTGVHVTAPGGKTLNVYRGGRNGNGSITTSQKAPLPDALRIEGASDGDGTLVRGVPE